MNRASLLIPLASFTFAAVPTALTSLRHVLVVFALLALTAGLAHGQEKPTLSVTFGSGSIIYPPGRWMPMVATLTNPTAGEIEGSVQAEMTLGGSPLTVVRLVRVPAQSRVSVDFLAAFDAPEQSSGKQGGSPLTIVYWKNKAGATLAQEPIQGIPDSADMGNKAGTGVPGVQILSIIDQPLTNEDEDAVDLPEQLQPTVDYAFSVTTVAASDLTRRVAALDASRLVVVHANAVESFDAAQRQVLLDHVRGGATLLLQAGPNFGASWLGEYLPMDYIDSRYATKIDAGTYGTLAYGNPSSRAVCEGRDGATVVAADDAGPLAAYRPLGLGRVAMVAFPLGAPDPASAEAGRLLSDVCGITGSTFHDTALGEPPAAATLLPSMIGQPAPAWNVAAVIAGTYAVGVAAVLSFCGTRHRPMALAGCVGGGVLLASGVFAWTASRSGDQPLLAARLTRLDVTDAATVRTELLTFYGQNRNDLEFAAPGAILRPVAGSDATLRQFPLTVEGLGSSTGKLDSVWQSRTIESGPPPVRARIGFNEGGADVDVRSDLPGAIENARIVSAGRTLPLPNIAPGTNNVRPAEAGRPGDYAAGGAVIADERSALRTEIVRQNFVRGANEAVGRARSTEPTLVGFIANPPRGGLQIAEGPKDISQTIVRAFAEFAPAATGAKVRIPPGFVRVERGPSVSLPMSTETGEYTESNQSGRWLLGLAAPGAVGTLAPSRVTLAVDASATGWAISLRAGQCAGGRVRENASASPVAAWDGAGGPKLVTIDVGPNDVDANGWLWLLMTADPRQTVGMGLGETPQGNWQILRLDATIDAAVTGPPQAPKATWTDPEEEARRAAKAARKPQSKPDAGPTDEPDEVP